MILVLNIKNSDQGAWQIVKNSQIILSHDFDIKRGEDKSVYHLCQMLIKNQFDLKDFTGFILLIKQASLTQIKIFTTNSNILAWQFNWPILAEYYFKGDDSKILNSLLKKLSKVKKFQAILPRYIHQADITISKKKAKYSIVK